MSDDPKESRARPASTLASGGALDTHSTMASAHTVGSQPERSSSVPPPSADTLSIAGASTPTVGDVLGERYRILAELGRGGEGIVYRARDVRADADVALKLVAPRFGGARRLERFRRELAMARRVTHPGVVRIHDLVELSGGFALSMELVLGESLEKRLTRSPPMSVEEIVALAGELTRALAAAHEAGVVHRDLKPANVLLRAGTGRAVITDFGVSRERAVVDVEGASDRAPSGVRITQEGALIGTPLYMAPEQLEGRVDIGPEADVYSLGLVLFEVATGRRPHEGRNADELRRARLSERPPALATLRPDLPFSLTDAVDRALETDPARRFSSAVEMSAALDARPSARAPRVEAPPSAKRRPTTKSAVARASLGATAIVALAAGALFLLPRASSPRNDHASLATPAAPPSWSSSFRLKNPRRLTFGDGCEEFPAYTPDSKRLVYDESTGADSYLMVRDIATGETTRLTHVHGWDFAAAVSRDGCSLAFLRSSDDNPMGTYTMDIEGKTPPKRLATGNVRPSFSPDGTAIWAGDATHPTRYSLDGIAGRSVPSPPGHAGLHVLELPDGRVVVDYAFAGWAVAGGIGLFDASGGYRSLLSGEMGEVLELTPDKRDVVSIRDTRMSAYALLAVPLDGGEAVPLSAPGIGVRKGFRIAPDGSSLAWSTCRGAQEMVRVADDGLSQAHTSGDWNDGDAVPLGDGANVLVMSDRAGSMQPWIVDRGGRVAPTRLDVGAIEADNAAATLDGTRVAMVSEKGVTLLDLSKSPIVVKALATGPYTMPSFRRGGLDVIASRTTGSAGKSEVVAIPIDGSAPRVIVPAPAADGAASPVDDLVVYLEGQEMKSRRPMLLDTTTGTKRPLSSALVVGDYSVPTFSRDGKRVAVVRGERHIDEVDVRTGKILRTTDSGGDEILRLAYASDALLAVRARWIGDLWMADAPN